jgi:hypothetical protein
LTDKRQQLLQLKDRLEKAAGPDRKIDRDIARILGWKHVTDFHIGTGPTDWCGDAPAGGGYGIRLPDWSASLDAAVTLVPEGFGIELQRYWRKEPGDWWSVGLSWGTDGDYVQALDRPSAALALCLARIEYELAALGEP